MEEKEKEKQRAICPSITIQSRLLKGGFQSFNFSPFIIELSKFHFSFKVIPSFKMLQKLSKCDNSNLELWLSLWLSLIQDINQISNEVRLLSFIKTKHFFLNIFIYISYWIK
ncbi:hypothetical protein VIGAN_06061700 [Vigna angularis var. angularis]|uniref:Uncharacterized protein n=1 Tax=Vigna angularis var. angularis TaxID=157739 RepID=A0A0S3S9W9_PHAAN|nr:hypothetical protein VIGAN_06061700 [Vigna angularis var. angularis]